jgi:hypothetical protein
MKHVIWIQNPSIVSVQGALLAQQAAYWVSGAENAGADFFAHGLSKNAIFRSGVGGVLAGSVRSTYPLNGVLRSCTKIQKHFTGDCRI